MENKIMCKRKNKEDGFSLIELLITVVVVTWISIALLSSFIHGFSVLSRMKQTAIATRCAHEELELIRNMSFDDILNLGTSFANPSGSLSLLQNSSGILSIEDSSGNNIKKLTLSVIWTCRGKQMRKDIATFITREGINKK